MSRKSLVMFATLTVLCWLSVPSALAQVSVTAANPSAAAPGTVNLNVTISGSGFKRGARAQFFLTGTTNPGGIAVTSTAFSSSSSVVATISVDASAADASYDIQITNSNGSSGKGTELFGVQNSSNNPNTCNGTPLRLIVAPQTIGMGGISGDGIALYYNAANPSDPFNGGTVYEDGVSGASVKFLGCPGGDFVLGLRGTSPQRYLNLDFSVQLAPPNTAGGAVNFTGKQLHQYGEQINEMGTLALSSGQFLTCSGLQMYDATYSTGGTWTTRTVTDGHTWFHPSSLYDPIVPGCNGGSGPDMANQPVDTSAVSVQQVDACTWTVSPLPDSTSVYDRAGIAETLKGKTSSYVYGGQFQMPFLYRIQKLGCTP